MFFNGQESTIMSTDAHLSGKTTMTSKEVMTIKVKMGFLRTGGANIGVETEWGSWGFEK